MAPPEAPSGGASTSVAPEQSTSPATPATFTSRDPPVITTEPLQANTDYTAALRLLNETEDPAEEITDEVEAEDDDEVEVEENTIVRRKRFEVMPMSAEEAIDQMELLSHDFYVFFIIKYDICTITSVIS